jgi:hypothetical protein
VREPHKGAGGNLTRGWQKIARRQKNKMLKKNKYCDIVK